MHSRIEICIRNWNKLTPQCSSQRGKRLTKEIYSKTVDQPEYIVIYFINNCCSQRFQGSPFSKAVALVYSRGLSLLLPSPNAWVTSAAVALAAISASFQWFQSVLQAARWALAGAEMI